MDNKYVNKALEISSKVASNVYLDAISKGYMGNFAFNFLVLNIVCWQAY